MPYGPYEDNAFDIFLVDAAEPTPLVVYIHGGGFTSGSKGIVYLSARNEIRETPAGGASYATIKYRLLKDDDEEGIIKCLNDSKRSIQFFRYHHEQLNVDPTRIAIYGAESLEELGTPEFQTYRANVDVLALMSLDDPEFWKLARGSTKALLSLAEKEGDGLKWPHSKMVTAKKPAAEKEDTHSDMQETGSDD